MGLMDGSSRRHKLSDRERECLIWISRGKTYVETAAILELSFGTIKTYLDSARYKLNAVNVPQACVLAVVHGLITHEEVLAGEAVR